MGRLQPAQASGLLTGARALVRTPRGGLHAYYQGTGQACGSLTRAGHFIDFKAAGGYVLAPPSRVHGKPYELLDHRGADGHLDWQAVRRLLDPPRAVAHRPPAAARSDATALIAWVEQLREGNRDNGLFWACCAAADSGYDIYEDLVAAGMRAGLSERDARRAARKAAGQ